MEIWREVAIDFYKERYLVSNYGNVKRKDGATISQNFDSKGYLKVTLYKNRIRKTIKVHRLVASTFIDNPENKPQVNHIDGVKTNNHIDNLEWATAKENIKHAYENNLAKIGSSRHSSKHILLKHRDGKLISQYSNLTVLANTIGISVGKLLKTLENNNVVFELINTIDSTLPLDIKLNSFCAKHTYCPIAIYDKDIILLAMYTNIASMTKHTMFSESIGNKAKLNEPIKHKKRSKRYKELYYIKKIIF